MLSIQEKIPKKVSRLLRYEEFFSNFNHMANDSAEVVKKKCLCPNLSSDFCLGIHPMDSLIVSSMSLLSCIVR